MKRTYLIILTISIVVITTSCTSLFKLVTSPAYTPDKPTPVHVAKITYKKGRPRIYNLPQIKRIAVFSFGDEKITDTITQILVNNSKWGVIDRANLDFIINEHNG